MSEEYNKLKSITDRILREFPVGNITEHTIETIPDRISYYLKELAEYTQRVEDLEDKKLDPKQPICTKCINNLTYYDGWHCQCEEKDIDHDCWINFDKSWEECAANLVDYAREFVQNLSAWGKGYDRYDKDIKQAEDAIEEFKRLKMKRNLMNELTEGIDVLAKKRKMDEEQYVNRNDLLKDYARIIDAQKKEIKDLHAELEYYRGFAEHLGAKKAVSQRDKMLEESKEIEQILGKALGYPWYKDDPKNFPNATEADGVCVGVETPWSLAMIAADKLKALSRSPVKDNWMLKPLHNPTED